jgi:hypothetical protein
LGTSGGNFYNYRDQILEAWKVDNRLVKPVTKIELNWLKHTLASYDFSPSSSGLSGKSMLTNITLGAVRSLRAVEDRPEIMAFVARSLTLAAGEELVTGNSIDKKSGFNLDAAMEFNGEHSAEWVWPIQWVIPYYDTLMQRLKVGVQP